MKKSNWKNKKGFTLVETLVAILILVVAISALFTLASNSLNAVRVSKNQTTALYLAQEAMDYVRSTRDDASLQLVVWDSWLEYFNVDQAGNQQPQGAPLTVGCYSPSGCLIDVMRTTVSPPVIGIHPGSVRECQPSQCEFFTFFQSPALSFYGYPSSGYPLPGLTPTPSGFARTIRMERSSLSPDEVIVTVSVEWYNTQNSTSTQSLSITQSLMNL